jgi:tetratricopeptide (TPR) repeat protein
VVLAVAWCSAATVAPVSVPAHGDPLHDVEEMTEALSQRPDDPTLLAERGHLYMEAEHWAEARADFDRVLALAPAQTVVLVERGDVRQRLGDCQGAVEDLDRAVALDIGRGFEVRARVRLSCSRDLAGAAEDLAQAIARAPRPEDVDLRGRLLRQLGRHIEAIASYEDGLAHLGEPVPLLLGLLETQIEVGRFDDALLTIGRVEAQTGRPDYLRRGSVLAAAHREAEAREAYAKALEQAEARLAAGRVSALALLQKAEALAGLGRSEEARSLVQAIDPSHHTLEEYRRMAQSLGMSEGVKP